MALLSPAIGITLALAVQEPQPVQRFKSSVDVVQVDVTATDASGRPIRNLTAADFELRVDGRVRPIVSAQFVSVPGAGPVPPAAQSPTHYSSNSGTTGGRLIVIAVDRSSIATGRGRAAIEAARRFVSQLNPGDRVALASIPEGPQVSFTADHTLVQRLLQQIDGIAVPSLGNRNIGVSEALGFERKDTNVMQTVLERECGVANVGPAGRGGGQSDSFICQGEVRAEANLVAADARQRARQSIRGLQALLERLAPSQVPKMVVFISEGLVVDREYAQLSWLDAKAAAAHVTIYPLMLETSDFEASRRRPPIGVAADRVVQEQGLAMVAQATGGDVFRILSNSDFAFQRLSNELSGYYLLGFEPDPKERNGRPHAIHVSVGKKGVTVRSRRQFTVGPEAAKTAPSEILGVLRDPLPASEIPIKLTTFSFRDPQSSRLRLLIAAEVDRSINPDGQMTVGYVVVDFDGKLVASQTDAALTATSKEGPRTGLYFNSVLLAPGKYTIKLVVVDDARRRGSVERVVQAHLTGLGPIRATDLLIADGAQPAANLPLVPAVSGEIAGATLHGYLELFSDAQEPLERANVTMEVAETESSSALERAPVALRVPEDNARCRIAGAAVDIGRLPPGDYVARAVIVIGSKTVGSISRPFKIARKSASLRSQ